MPYSASQLIRLACQIAKVPGQTQQAGQFLNMILADYAQTMDLDKIRTPTTLNVDGSSASYPLPADYLRAVQVRYSVNGTITDLNQISLEEYNDLFQGAGVDNYPYSYATDISQSPPLMWFYPPPAIPLAVEILYRPQVDDITSPEASAVIPWFPNQRVLLRDLCVDLMLLGDDSRRDSVQRDVEDRMRKYLIMDDDKEGFAQTVKLDRRQFRNTNDAKPTKQQPF